MKKINMLFEATILTNIYEKKAARSGAFFVAYNVLKELVRQPVFNITLSVRYDDRKYIRKMKRDPFLSSFSFIPMREKQYILSKMVVHQKQMRATGNIGMKLIHCLQIIKNVLELIQYHIFFSSNDRTIRSFDICFSPLYGISDEIKKYPRIKRFIILHDTIPIQNGILSSPDFNNQWFIKIMRSLDAETWCFCVSSSGKRDFLKSIGDFERSLDENKMIVTPNATANVFSPRYDKTMLNSIFKKYGIDHKNSDNYIFSLCSIDPRKNLLFTVACFIKFIQKHTISNLYFYLGGAHFTDFIAQFEEKLEMFTEYRDKIVRLGYVDDEDVNILYSNSLFFTYLSRYEGFGMPPLEAMQAGTPVITSNNSSLPEVVGDAAITIDYDSEEQCIKAFEDLYFNESLRKEYIAKGLERAKLFSWEKTVGKMTDIIITAVSSE